MIKVIDSGNSYGIVEFEKAVNNFLALYPKHKLHIKYRDSYLVVIVEYDDAIQE